MKCLVTGATGFIGRELCRRLASEGHSVVALSRSGQPLPDGTATRALDLATEAVDTALLSGVDVVIHLAGIAHQHAPAEDYRVLNVDATVRLYQAACAAGVRRFIFASSVKAMGPAATEAARAEADCTPPRDPYGRSKRDAELALEEICSEGTALVVIRPTLVYGKGASGNLRLLARAVRYGLPRPPALGRRSLIALDDLVDLFCMLLDAPVATCQTWIACGPDAYSTRDLYDLLRTAAGLGEGIAWLPLPGWRLLGRLLDLRTGEPAGSAHDKMFAAEVYDGSAVSRATGWQPRRNLGDSLPALCDGGESAS